MNKTLFFPQIKNSFIILNFLYYTLPPIVWKNNFLVVLTFKLIANAQYTEKFSTYIFNTSLAVSNYN